MRQNEKEMKQLRGQDPRRSSALIIRHTLTQADGKDSLATCAALTESRKTLFCKHVIFPHSFCHPKFSWRGRNKEPRMPVLSLFLF